MIENTELTPFGEALHNICVGWIGEEIGWQDYIATNGKALLDIAIKDYTTEELRAELKRRQELLQKEMEKVLRCRDCKHCQPHPQFPRTHFLCMARTWGKKRVWHYTVTPSKIACDKFERKAMEGGEP